MLLDEFILFGFELDGDVILFCDSIALLRKILYLELLNYFGSLGFLLFDLLHNLCLVTLLAQIGEFAHGLIQHGKQLVCL